MYGSLFNLTDIAYYLYLLYYIDFAISHSPFHILATLYSPHQLRSGELLGMYVSLCNTAHIADNRYLIYSTDFPSSIHISTMSHGPRQRCLEWLFGMYESIFNATNLAYHCCLIYFAISPAYMAMFFEIADPPFLLWNPGYTQDVC
jgi:hypothetical protein